LVLSKSYLKFKVAENLLCIKAIEGIVLKLAIHYELSLTCKSIIDTKQSFKNCFAITQRSSLIHCEIIIFPCKSWWCWWNYIKRLPAKLVSLAHRRLGLKAPHV
jgi:hypothetical protein